MAQATQLTFPIHPAAELFPMMADAELRELANDIKENGLLEPIVVHDNKVLDGRNRLRACEIAGVDAEFDYPEIQSPVAYVVSKNVHRRHLTTGQKAIIAGEIVPLLREEAKARQVSHLKRGGAASPVTANSSERGEVREIAAKLVGVGSGAVQQAINAKRDNPEGYERVKRGELSINAAAHGHIEPPKPGGQPSAGSPDTPRKQQIAEAAKRRMVSAISHATGVCAGLASADIPLLKSTLDKEEIQLWANKAREIAKGFRDFASQLEKN